MGAYQQLVLPRLIDLALSGRQVGRLRARLTEGLDGVVLEVGFGSGANLAYYPKAVTKVLAVEPSPAARRLAARRLLGRDLPVSFVGLAGEELPVADESADHAVCSFTLCSVDDPLKTVMEMARVLRPGGTLRFVEHGRVPSGQTGVWQDRLTPLQMRLAGGCRLNRRPDLTVAEAGLVLQRLEHPRIVGPRLLTHIYAGVATKP